MYEKDGSQGELSMAQRIRKRRIYLIDKPFQYAFMLRFTGAVVAGILLAFLVLLVYYAVRYSQGNLAMRFYYVSGQPGTPLEQTTLLSVVLPALALSALLSAVFAVVVGLLYSHRIAGPLYHLRRVLREMREGKLDREVHFRKGDEFQGLADEVTQTMAWVRERLGRRR